MEVLENSCLAAEPSRKPGALPSRGQPGQQGLTNPKFLANLANQGSARLRCPIPNAGWAAAAGAAPTTARAPGPKARTLGDGPLS